jgi:hypothetical protein
MRPASAARQHFGTSEARSAVAIQFRGRTNVDTMRAGNVVRQKRGAGCQGSLCGGSAFQIEIVIFEKKWSSKPWRISAQTHDNSIFKSSVTLSTSPCRAIALSAACLRVTNDLEME